MFRRNRNAVPPDQDVEVTPTPTRPITAQELGRLGTMGAAAFMQEDEPESTEASYTTATLADLGSPEDGVGSVPFGQI